MARLIKSAVHGLIILAMVLVSVSCIQGSIQQKTVPGAPVIVVQPSLLTFDIPAGSAPVSTQTLSIKNKGTGTISWVVGDNAPWITIQQDPGTNTAQEPGVIVVVDTKNLSAGEYTGIVTIYSEGALNSPVYVPVTLTVGSTGPKTPAAALPDSLSAASSASIKPAETAAVWKNQTELYRYSDINACIVRGSIANTDKIWYMGNVQIITQSGRSANIAETILPGEQVIYYRYIPCFDKETVRLSYNWYR